MRYATLRLSRARALAKPTGEIRGLIYTLFYDLLGRTNYLLVLACIASKFPFRGLHSTALQLALYLCSLTNVPTCILGLCIPLRQQKSTLPLPCVASPRRARAGNKRARARAKCCQIANCPFSRSGIASSVTSTRTAKREPMER